VWRVGDPMPRHYDELYLNEQWNKGFIHVDVDRMTAGEPFVFNSGAQPDQEMGDISSPVGGGGDVIQEWGVVRGSLKQHLVLPGVGSARATLASLGELGLLAPLEASVRAGLPFLGICVGLQILFEHSEEEDVRCLGWFPGRVKRYAGSGLRVPQIGWNLVTRRRDHAVFAGLPEAGHYYFVNSYYVALDDPTLLLGEAEYGTRFAAIVARDNVVAAQFHIEKRGPLGLKLLDNFAKQGSSC